MQLFYSNNLTGPRDWCVVYVNFTPAHWAFVAYVSRIVHQSEWGPQTRRVDWRVQVLCFRFSYTKGQDTNKDFR